VQSVAPGASGSVLTSNGTTWQSAALPATNWATPGTIGSATPNTGAFTSITSSAQAGYEAKPFGAATGNTGEVRFDELAANGTNYVGFKAPDVIGTNKVWVLPATDGTAGQVLKTDGIGNLGWASDGGGTVTSVGITAPGAGITVSGSPITASGNMTLALANDLSAVEALTTTGLAKRTANDTWTTVADNSANWDSAYTDRLKWGGGATGLVAATGRTSLGLGNLATLSAVGSSEISDGSISDADISASAAIVDSKLATISTAGKVSGAAITSGTIGGSTAMTTSGNITTSGSVGIGTTSPNDKLQVVGNISGDSLSVGPYLTAYNAGIELGNSSGTSTVPYIDFHYGTGSAQDYNTRIINSGNNRLDFTNWVGTPLSLNAGNVGIATTSPGSKLQVNGNAAIGYSAATAGPANGLAVSGNVGIGTTAPAALLQAGSLTEITPATNTGTIKVTGTTQTSLESVGGIELPIATNGYGIKMQALSDTGSSFAIARRNASATWSESLRINANGNVGIGTTAPTQALDVNGTIRTSHVSITGSRCSWSGWACSPTCAA